MPKKTSRAARSVQTQRSTERKPAARPLVNPENSRLSAQAEQPNLSNNTITLVEEAEPELELADTKATPRIIAPEVPAVANLRSASRRPIARRTTLMANRQPVISREEEYAYIRSDLITVTALTLLMIVLLVVLTFILS